MSSVRYDSMQFLREVLMANIMNFQKYQKQFKAQETRLLQRPDQKGALTAEQQDLNKRVNAVSDDFMATAKQMRELDSLFVDYNCCFAQPNDQPQLRNQIQAMMINDVRPMFRNLVARLEELEGINK